MGEWNYFNQSRVQLRRTTVDKFPVYHKEAAPAIHAPRAFNGGEKLTERQMYKTKGLATTLLRYDSGLAGKLAESLLRLDRSTLPYPGANFNRLLPRQRVRSLAGVGKVLQSQLSKNFLPLFAETLRPACHQLLPVPSHHQQLVYHLLIKFRSGIGNLIISELLIILHIHRQHKRVAAHLAQRRPIG